MTELGIDYRIIVVSRYGSPEKPIGLTDIPVCISAPTGSSDCSQAATEPLVDNPPRFYQYSADIEDTNSLCQLLKGYDQPDELAEDKRTPPWTPVAPLGWSQYLRPDSFKAIIIASDDEVDCGTFTGVSSTAVARDAAAFDKDLSALSPTHFGTPSARNYGFYSMIGISSKAGLLGPTDPVEEKVCTDSSRADVSAAQHAHRRVPLFALQQSKLAGLVPDHRTRGPQPCGLPVAGAVSGCVLTQNNTSRDAPPELLVPCYFL